MMQNSAPRNICKAGCLCSACLLSRTHLAPTPLQQEQGLPCQRPPAAQPDDAPRTTCCQGADDCVQAVSTCAASAWSKKAECHYYSVRGYQASECAAIQLRTVTTSVIVSSQRITCADALNQCTCLCCCGCLACTGSTETRQAVIIRLHKHFHRSGRQLALYQACQRFSTGVCATRRMVPPVELDAQVCRQRHRYNSRVFLAYKLVMSMLLLRRMMLMLGCGLRYAMLVWLNIYKTAVSCLILQRCPWHAVARAG
jgi:hypothetical protein